MDVENSGNKRVFHRLGTASNRTHHYFQGQQAKVCYHWQAGRCSRNPCHFLHGDPAASSSSSFNGGGGGATTLSKRPHSLGGVADEGFSMRKSPNFNNTWGRGGGATSNGFRGVVKKSEKLCNYWIQGNCSFGDKCRYLHSWSVGDGFSLLTTLEGHQKGVTGIALPSGSDKLYTGGKDENMRIWDCQSGQCTGVYNLAGEVGCIISEGPFIFVGLPNMVKALNTQSGGDQSLSGPVGQVYSLAVGNGLLFAGIQDGKILVWKFNTATNCFEPAASLEGHTLAVVTLFVGANKLFSGSMDNSIRVWNLDTLECMQILTDHTSVVMSLICWDQFLLSCSLDKTIKIWVATESGKLEVTYTHNEEHGLLALCGVHDSEAKPILLCSCNDNTVRMYDLPSFVERGKIYSKQEIRSFHTIPAGLIFTGDGGGQVRVWKWSKEASSSAV